MQDDTALCVCRMTLPCVCAGFASLVFDLLYTCRLPNGSQALDVEGLRMFVKEMESLPCTLPALEPLRVRVSCNHRWGHGG